MTKEIAFLIFAAFRDSVEHLIYNNETFPEVDKIQAAVRVQATFTSMLTKDALFLWEEYLELVG